MELLIPIAVLGLLASVSPTTLVVFILLLTTIRARLNALAFFVGWGLSLTVVFAFSYAIGSAASEGRARSAAADLVEMLLGAVLVVVGVRQWRRRDEPRSPSRFTRGLSSHLQRIRPWESAVVGVLEQPWTLTAAAAVVVVSHHTGALVAILAFVVFTAISTATIAGIFLYYSRDPGAARVRLDSWRGELVRATPSIIALVSLMVGTYLVIDSAVGLARP
jgi:hypothetical protein